MIRCVCVVNVQAVDGHIDVKLPAAAADDDDDDDVGGLYLKVQTVDELMDRVSHDETLHSQSDYDSLAPPAAPLRSILSITPRSVTPKSSRSRVRLMDELTEVRSRSGSRSPSPVLTGRSRSQSMRSRSHSVASIVDDEMLTGRSTASVSTESLQPATDPHPPHRFRSGRKSSEPLSGSSGRRSRQGSRRMSDTASVIYSEDFMSARTSVDYSSEKTSSASDDTQHQTTHRYDMLHRYRYVTCN